MPIRRSRRVSIATQYVPHHVPKIFLVGPSQSGKSNFVESLTGPAIENSMPSIFSKFDNIGLEAYPIKYQGKSYNLWDANTHLDEHLVSWGQNSDLIIVFGQDQSWFDKVSNLFPNTQIKMFNPDSVISNLKP